MTDSAATLPDDYPEFLEQLTTQVRQARIRATRGVNTELLTLYWDIGRSIIDRRRHEGGGVQVIDQLSAELRAAFPEMRGLSRSSLKYMRHMASVWPRTAIGQQPVGRLPWGHIVVLLDRLDTMAERDWYAAAAAEYGWSRPVLIAQINRRLHRRIDFADHLPPDESDLVRDPYVFDFLGFTDRVAERELGAALMARLETFFLELGQGFAFVGRQYHFTVDGDDFYIDLLFFNWTWSRFVVVELKVGRFEPESAGNLGSYVSWVDENLRLPDRHGATIGILLCAALGDNVVRYFLAGAPAPPAAANYTYDTLPDPIRKLVPTDDELASVVDEALSELATHAPEGMAGPDGEP